MIDLINGLPEWGSSPGDVEKLHRAPAVVIGAGAAGLFAALFAARGGAHVVLLESRSTPGAKIRVSGGGRCNVLPSRVELGDFHTAGSRYVLRNILLSWSLSEIHRFFEDDLCVPLKVEETGKVFPRSDSSKEVVEALLAACDRAGVNLQGGRRVVGLQRQDREGGARFAIQLEGGGALEARRVVLATGGLSLPKTGSDGAGYRFARELGHTIRPTYPALVPLRSADSAWRALAGISGEVLVRVASQEENEERRGDLLVTHEGFSGPVILDVSRRFTGPRAPDAAPARLEIGWGARDARAWDEALRGGGGGTIAAAVRDHLPRRLADFLLERAGVDPGAKIATLARAARMTLANALGACSVEIEGNLGYAKAEVTAGGVPLEEVDRTTLESRIVPGLHFAGEIFDATGRIGGYNFLWAWITGRAAGLALAARDE